MYNFNLIPQVKSLNCTQGQIQAADLRIPESLTAFVPKAGEIFPCSGNLDIRFELSPALEKEAYTVSVTSGGVQIGCSAPNGLYYALATLRQLAKLNGGAIPCCEIQDAPELELRGYSDDISRKQISTLENFKDIVRRLSEIKCNLYMPYIEDVFQFDCIPQSGRFSDPVPKAEWRELVAYAKDYYVQIIPIINLLGHWDKNAALRDFKDLMLRDCDGGITPILDVRKPEVQQMVRNMMDEIVDVFRDCECIHAGGDEVFAYTERFGKEQAKAYYNGHYKMIHDYLAARGKKLMMYSDMYTPVYGSGQLRPEAIDEMPRDISFVFWDYGCRDHYHNIDMLKDHGVRFLISPTTYSWGSFLPHHRGGWMNTRRLARQAGSACAGMIMSGWCDGGTTLREENWFGLHCEAVYAWDTQSEMTFEQIVSAYYQLFFGLTIDPAEYASLYSYDAKFLNERGERNERQWYGDWIQSGIDLGRWFWEPAWMPADPALKAGFADSLKLLERGFAYFSSLEPSENRNAYAVFLFDLRRSVAAARKLDLQRTGAYEDREAAMADIPAWEALAQEVRTLMEENEKLWLATNRMSEWMHAKSLYEDLYDSIRSVIRYCRYSTRMTAEKHIR